MPVAPPQQTAPYDIANTILNTARMRLNDKLKAIAPYTGRILDETEAATQTAFNAGYRRFQDELSDASVYLLTKTSIITGLPPTTNFDPASLCSLSWTQFFDGSNYFAGPVLPYDLITPLSCSDRWSVAGNQQNQWPFPPADRPNMRLMVDGMNSQYKFQYNRQWKWEGDVMYFPGTIQAVDFQLRYAAFLPDIQDLAGVRWFKQPVPIMRCLEPMAWWVAREFCVARTADGDAQELMLSVAQECESQAIDATKKIANRDARMDERVSPRRRPYGGGSRGGGGLRGGWGGW